MTINDPKGFVAGLWDWSILDGCFGNTGIRVGDADGMVERNCRTLLIDPKAPGTLLKPGQMRMWRNQSLTGWITVYVVWGDTDKPEHIQIYTKKKIYQKMPCDMELFRDLVKSWFDYASKSKSLEDKRGA